jgi:hypothetical protein
MRHWRPEHEGVRHVRQSDVVGITAMPGDEAQILMPSYGLADAEFLGAPLVRTLALDFARYHGANAQTVTRT